MALQQCPHRAGLKSEMRDLCGNVVGQDGASNPPLLLLDPAWRKCCLEHQQCSEPSSRGAHPLFGDTSGSPEGNLGVWRSEYPVVPHKAFQE